jgi:hypothetical protein
VPLPTSPIVLATDGRHPWEQQVGEGKLRFSQFVAYRDQGPTRRLEKVSEGFGITRATAKQYERLFLWSQRAASFDKYMDAQWILALREHTKTMVRRHLTMAEKVRERVMSALESVDPTKLTPTELVRFADLYSKLSRVALGEPEQHIAVTGKAGAPPIAVTSVPGDEASRQEQMRQATVELAQRLGIEAMNLTAEDVLALPE